MVLTLSGLTEFASRAEAQPQNLDRWLLLQSANFQLYSESDVITSRETLKHLESFRAVLKRFSPEIKLVSSTPTRIFLFDSVSSYEPYKTSSQQGVNILGQFIRHRDGNYLTLQIGKNPLGALAVGGHEYVHHLVRTNFPAAPTWFDEGLAEYYSTFAVEAGVAIVGRPVERHLRQLIGPARLELDSLLKGEAPFLDPDGSERTEINYALSWALVHFLLSTESQMSGQLIDMLAGLSPPAGRNSNAADLGKAFSRGWHRLEEELESYVARAHFPVGKIPLQDLEVSLDPRLETIAPAALLTQLGFLAQYTEHESEALKHFEAALEFDPEHRGALKGLESMAFHEAITP